MPELLSSLYKPIERIAERGNCSVDQLINIVVAEKVAVLDAEYLQQRKGESKGKAKQALYALAKLAGNETPGQGDEMPTPQEANASVNRSMSAGHARGE